MEILSLGLMSLDSFEYRDNLTDSTVWNSGETGDIYWFRFKFINCWLSSSNRLLQPLIFTLTNRLEIEKSVLPWTLLFPCPVLPLPSMPFCPLLWPFFFPYPHHFLLLAFPSPALPTILPTAPAFLFALPTALPTHSFPKVLPKTGISLPSTQSCSSLPCPVSLSIALAFCIFNCPTLLPSPALFYSPPPLLKALSTALSNLRAIQWGPSRSTCLESNYICVWQFPAK